jgi:gluconate 5-dehydrogenase
MHNKSTDYFSRYSLAGRTALVTGAGSGIGRAIAAHLGLAGARVVVNDLDEQRCAESMQLLHESGVTARPLAYDVGDADAVQRAAQRLEREDWGVDILVSNAGIQLRTPFQDVSREAWRKVLDTHLDGAFLHCQAYLPAMVRRNFGRVLIVGSVVALAALPRQPAYIAAKGALTSMVRSLAVDYGAFGITCNTLAPGATRTPLTGSLHGDPVVDQYITSAVPAQRWGEPDDIASAATFLASNAASFINGQVLAIDGGWTARL